MASQEFLGVLATVPGAQPVPTGEGFGEAVLLGGVEVARAVAAEESELRTLWQSRRARGALPLLIVSVAPGGDEILALGPSTGDEPLRSVQPSDLRRALETLPTLEPLAAVRHLAAELERLDTQRAPRMGEPGYFPDHNAERREEYRRTTPGERMAETIAISRVATRIAAAAAARRRGP